MFRSHGLSLAVAAGVALVLATHVFVDIDLLRFKIVQSPVAAVGGEVHASSSGSAVSALTPPFALIGRIHNPSSEPASFTIAIDGTVVCTARIPAARTKRFDCGIARPWSGGDEHSVAIRGQQSAWELEYLELATHHGGTSGERGLVVLPAGSKIDARLPAVWVVLASLAVLALLVLPRRPSWRRFAWHVYRIVAGIIVVFFLLIQASEWCSRYRVVLSASSFFFWLAVLLAPWILSALRWMLQRSDVPADRFHRVVRAAFVGAVVLLAFSAFVQAKLADSYGGNYSGFLFVSARAFHDNPLLTSRDEVRRTLVLNPGGGYDGQFMYFVAFDPWLRALRRTPERYRAVVDAPPYRYGRIGYVLLTLVFSAGQWERYPATMVWLILGALAACAFALAMIAQERGATPAVGLLVAAIPGFWQSLEYGLPEPIAAATLLAGIFCVWHARWIPAALLLALSLLVRETGIVAMLAILAASLLANRRREAIPVALFVIGIVMLWRLYVMWALFADWGVRGLLFHPDDLGWPLGGFIELWRAIGRGHYYEGTSELSRAGMVYPVLVIAGFVLSCVLLAIRRMSLHIAAAAYGLLAICLNYEAIWVHVGNGVRGTYELFLLLAVATTAIRTYSKPVQVGMIAFWSFAALYVLFLSPNAAYIRTALAIPL